MLNPEFPSSTPALIDPASKAFQSLLDKVDFSAYQDAHTGASTITTLPRLQRVRAKVVH